MMIGLTNETFRKFSMKHVNGRGRDSLPLPFTPREVRSIKLTVLKKSGSGSEDELDNLESPTSWHSEPESQNAREARKEELLLSKKEYL